jgi:hypothetical protein
VFIRACSGFKGADQRWRWCEGKLEGRATISTTLGACRRQQRHLPTSIPFAPCPSFLACLLSLLPMDVPVIDPDLDRMKASLVRHTAIQCARSLAAGCTAPPPPGQALTSFSLRTPLFILWRLPCRLEAPRSLRCSCHRSILPTRSGPSNGRSMGSCGRPHWPSLSPARRPAL